MLITELDLDKEFKRKKDHVWIERRGDFFFECECPETLFTPSKEDLKATDWENLDSIESQEIDPLESILEAFEDAMSNFLFYDRKQPDQDLPFGVIQEYFEKNPEDIKLLEKRMRELLKE